MQSALFWRWAHYLRVSKAHTTLVTLLIRMARLDIGTVRRPTLITGTLRGMCQRHALIHSILGTTMDGSTRSIHSTHGTELIAITIDG